MSRQQPKMIRRHGDKLSTYPACKATTPPTELRYGETVFRTLSPAHSTHSARPRPRSMCALPTHHMCGRGECCGEQDNSRGQPVTDREARRRAMARLRTADCTQRVSCCTTLLHAESFLLHVTVKVYVIPRALGQDNKSEYTHNSTLESWVT